MSRQDELAIIGFAIKNKDIHEQLLADLSQDHFNFQDTKQAYAIICGMIANNVAPTPQTLGREMQDGSDFIAIVYKAAGTVLNPSTSFAALKRQYNRRQYARVAELLMEYTMQDDFTEEGAEDIIAAFSPVLNLEANPDSMIEAKQAAENAKTSLEKRMETPGQITGLRITRNDGRGAVLGFPQLEDAINGLEEGTLSVFAAQSGKGKTALAMNLSNVLNYHNGKRVYYLNTEMNVDVMMDRWAAMEMQIEFKRLRRGDITASEKERYDYWVNQFSKSPILLSRIPGLTLKMSEGLVKHAIKKYGWLDCVIVDYIGRMDMDTKRNLQEYQIISKLAQGLKELASDTGIPFITLAQLNHEGELEGAKKIINDCDNLIYFKPKTETVEVDGKKVEMTSSFEYLFVKQKIRNGDPSVPIHCEFDKKYQFIREV